MLASRPMTREPQPSWTEEALRRDEIRRKASPRVLPLPSSPLSPRSPHEDATALAAAHITFARQQRERELGHGETEGRLNEVIERLAAVRVGPQRAQRHTQIIRQDRPDLER